MPIKIVSGDITQLNCDAIVCPAQWYGQKSKGSLAEKIHAAAGPRLAHDCDRLGLGHSCEAGVTAGFNINCKIIVHLCYTDWCESKKVRLSELRSSYINVLEAAKIHYCHSIAIPLLYDEIDLFDKNELVDVALDMIKLFVKYNEDIFVYLVVPAEYLE